MGFKQNQLSSKTQSISYKSNLQSYYNTLYDQSSNSLLNQGHQKSQIHKTLLSIFSRTKIPTKTNSNRLLQLLDIDKIISINQRSLKQNSQEIKHMRMVASIKHSNQPQIQQSNQNTQGGSRHFNDLIRMARLHMLQRTNQPRGDQSSDQQNQVNPRLQRLRQIRIQRLRNNRNNTNN